MRISRADVFRYTLGLRHPVRMRFGTVTERRGLLLRLVCADSGAEGWGEAAPLDGFSPDTLAEAEATLVALVRVLRNRLRRPEDVLLDLDALAPGPAVRFAAEAAIVAADAARRGTTEAHVLAGPDARPARHVALAGLVTDGEDPRTLAERFVREGYTAVKLKVGGDPLADALAARTLARALGPGVALRLDANRAWTGDEARRFADALGDTPIAYIEEPLQDPEGLPRLADETGLPIALDESLVGQGASCLAGLAFARAVVLKPTVGGGLHWAHAMADEARRLGMEPVVSGAFESGVGTRALLAFAAAHAPAPAGLDPHTRLADDVLRPRLDLARARVDVSAVLDGGRVALSALEPVDVA